MTVMYLRRCKVSARSLLLPGTIALYRPMGYRFGTFQAGGSTCHYWQWRARVSVKESAAIGFGSVSRATKFWLRREIYEGQNDGSGGIGRGGCCGGGGGDGGGWGDGCGGGEDAGGGGAGAASYGAEGHQPDGDGRGHCIAPARHT